jgi:hypothetical protein
VVKIGRKIHRRSTKRAIYALPKTAKRSIYALFEKTGRRLNPAFNQCGEDWPKNPPKIHQKIPPKLPRVIFKYYTVVKDFLKEVFGNIGSISYASSNFIQFLKFPQCERSEPLFPNNHLLNFRLVLQFMSFFNFIQFLKFPQCERSEPLFPNEVVLQFEMRRAMSWV